MKFKTIRLFLLGTLVGFWVGMFAGLLAPYHRHDWTKWEQKDNRVLHILQGWGKAEVIGEGIESVEFRSCKSCGHYVERKID